MTSYKKMISPKFMQNIHFIDKMIFRDKRCY